MPHAIVLTRLPGAGFTLLAVIRMKRLVRCMFFLFLATAVAGKSDDAPRPFGPMHILEVGLNGEYAISQPTSVRLQIANSQPQALTLELQIRSGYQRGIVADTFLQQVTLAPNEQHELELPVLLQSAGPSFVLEVTAMDAGGRAVAYDWLGQGNRLSSSFDVRGSVGLICVSNATCKAAQEQAQFSGTMEERVAKNKKLHFILLNAPREYWWAYTALRSLILAAPTIGYSAQQKAAIETFARRGGRLILLEKEIADPAFLASYRRGAVKQEAVPISRGKLFRVTSLQAKALGQLFTGGTLGEISEAVQTIITGVSRFAGTGIGMSWFRRRAATQFSFPRLRWLLIWLAVYIMFLGLVNFAVLRRLRRLEWGWLTVVAGALIFAAGFYVSSSRHRPTQFTLDNLAIYWLDPGSPNAFADYGIRVSAPERQNVNLTVSEAAVISSVAKRSADSVNVGAEIRDRAVTPGWQVRLGPPRQIEVPLLRWSFSDYDFEGPRRFAGTVREVAPGRLRNETGVAMRDALVVDFASEKTWPVGAMAANAEVSLADIGSKPLYETQQQKNEAQALFSNAPPGPLSLAELARFARLTYTTRRVLLGLADAPALTAELDGIAYAQRTRALFVVVLE